MVVSIRNAEATTTERNMVVKPFQTEYHHFRSGTAWTWVILGGLAGYLVIHPAVMIAAYRMAESGSRLHPTIVEVFSTALSKSFSPQMLPWGISFAALCALAGGLFGRIRRVNTALRLSEQKYRRLSITDELTGLYNVRYFFRRLK